MIVQTAPPGEPRFMMTMSEHTAFASQIARAFGNDEFESVSPRDEVLHIVDHHDDGWSLFDAGIHIDRESGVPYHLVHTPLEEILKTSARSPSLNEEYHPYCGLLSSMHSWGLYNGRYGLSDKVLINGIDPAVRLKVDRMLDGELERQGRLKEKLAADPITAEWLDGSHVMQNYKQLQFFDTLSLYFHCNHAIERGVDAFPHVPKNAVDDVTIKIEPRGGDVYSLAPFPFSQSTIELAFAGRYVQPVSQAGEDDPQARIAKTPRRWQTVWLSAA